VRKLGPGKLVIASHNEGKVRELRDLLGPYGVEPVSAAELDLPEPDEIGVNFIENADLKARQAADLSGLPALADDSGLCVEALGDRPGIFSARWAVGDDGSRDFLRAMQRVEDELAALGPEASRDAHFVCALALVWPDGESEWFQGPPSSRSAATRRSGRWSPTRSTASATGPTPSASWSRPCCDCTHRPR